MVQQEVQIKNRAGIHCRPAAIITREAMQYDGVASVLSRNGADCKLGSAMGLLMLALQYGDRVTVRIEGPDELNALKRFVELFETEFDFPDAGAE